ncbi:heavy-metal-associated domain-containing protein [Erysipelothrix inopinata]|uniref:Heavy-metal-associated domain-containing protein n=1 Tax=Erysipelothrix inopinata TaxID=225084 RepID=A0A7G9S1D7_9FIRM|nr:heavy-metal-associated domain-containing protein [Erysipelothrix inopinata]QNN61662.1 heavy-metal-associated domain-containing protein [Erysipelothrix inopinata]
MEKQYLVEGMTCNHCKARVEKAIEAVEGAEVVSIDVDSKQAILNVENEDVAMEVKEAVANSGYALKE